MYGSIDNNDANNKVITEPLLTALQEEDDDEEQEKKKKKNAPSSSSSSKNPRRQIHRQKTKRKLKEIQKEQPVFRTLFDEKRKVTTKSLHQAKQPSRKRLPSREQQQPQQQRSSRTTTNAITQKKTTTAAAHKKKKKHHQHSFLYSLLSPYSTKWQARIFKRFISIVILTDLILFILSTDPNIASSSSSGGSSSSFLTEQFFHVAEGIASSIFLIEYLARLYCITEKTKYGQYGPIRGRLLYMTTWPAVIDLLATLPFFLELPTGLDLPTLTYLRFFRLFRILKTDSYIMAMDAVYRVVYYNREILTVATLVCVFLVLFTAVLLYLCRPPGDSNANNFDSIGDTLFIATMMLTGQGGPEGDLPWYTKAVVLLTSVFSVAMFAIPASMLTWGFEAEAERMARRARKRALQEKKRSLSSSTSPEQQGASARTSSSCSSTYSGASGGTDGDDEWSSSSSSSSAWTVSDSDGDTTDEEYFKLIAGEDDGDNDNEEEEPWMKQIRADFALADSDMDGTLTLKEFLRMQFAVHQQQEGKDNATLQQQQQALPNTTTTTTAATNLAKRLETVEKQVAENAQKLDQILALLENKKSSKRW